MNSPRYLHTGGAFARALPQLRAKLLAAAAKVDEEQGWGLVSAAGARARPRCVEYHRVGPRGALPFARHHDAGSLVTLDVMLADPRAGEFEGSAFQTLEADGALRSYPEFARGDCLVFVSHKPHCVAPVTRGERRVLVMELWEGEERACAHRCDRHWGECRHSARASFWQRAVLEGWSGDDL